MKCRLNPYSQRVCRVADYVIGDVQGCYEPLMRLLENIQFDEKKDRLWFVGDLVNRGTHSLEVLRFIKALVLTPRITLGNHDLYLLTRLFTASTWSNPDDTLDAILNAPDAEELGQWLRLQPLLYYDNAFNVAMCHAGIAPIWNLEQAMAYAIDVEDVLRGDDYVAYLTALYGNEPNYWHESIKGMDRLRVITNYFTRMRFCDAQGRLCLTNKGSPDVAPNGCYPWYALPTRVPIQATLVFGHWAAIGGGCFAGNIYALDTGCLWGGRLTALRLEDKQLFSVSGS